jgi:hypothetical protein
VRAYLDVEARPDGLFAVVTAVGLPRRERPVAWAGEPGRRLLAARDTAGEVQGAAALAAAVDQGRAAAPELDQYGSLLFEAAFGGQLWAQLIDAAAAQQRHAGTPGLPYLELAVRGPADGTGAAVHALRWEALHDGTRAVAAQGTSHDDVAGNVTDSADVSVGIVRLVPFDAGPLAGAGLVPAGQAVAADQALIEHIPRVLFAVGSPLTDPAVRPATELMGIMQDLESDGGSIHPRILDSATLAALRAALGDFRPDVLHLIGHGTRLGGEQVAIQLRPEPGGSGPADQWVTAEQLLGAFGKARHTPRLVILSACQTASAADRVNAAPFAAQLVAGGVPVVIAMAGDIADTACRVFTRALTSALGTGVPLGTAVLRGRRAAFYQRPGFWSTDWVLPTVFLAERLPEQARLVNAQNAETVRERANKFGLAQSPVFYGRREFIDAMDRLLDGRDPLNVLLAYTPDPNRSYGGERLLRQLGARAVRLGVLPLLLGPFDQLPPTSRTKLAKEIRKSIQNVRVLLDLPPDPPAFRVTITAADPDAEPFDLALAIRADLDDLLSDLPDDDPVWRREAGQPRVVLLCHRVDGWLDALDDLLGMLGPTGLHPGPVPLPVVATGADIPALSSVRKDRWNGRRWVKAALLDRFPTDADEDLLAYQWWLLNPPERKPVYAPRRSAPPGWRKMLRWVMQDCIYDENKLFGWAEAAQDDYFTSEMDSDLLASFARAAP